MDDVPVPKIIFIATMMEKSFGKPLNSNLLYGKSLVFEMGNVEPLRNSLWERDQAEMEVYQAEGTEFTASDYNATMDENYNHNVESWSLVLYLICFLILIIFFLLISIMEVCCKRTVLNVPSEEQTVGGSPPPYDLFGPPSYDSLYEAKCGKQKKKKKKKKKNKFNIFVINLPKRKRNLNLEGRDNPAEVQEDISPPPPP